MDEPRIVGNEESIDGVDAAAARRECAPFVSLTAAGAVVPADAQARCDAPPPSHARFKTLPPRPHTRHCERALGEAHTHWGTAMGTMIKPMDQLTYAIDHLPRSNGSPTARVVVEVPAALSPSPLPMPADEPDARGPTLEFHRGTLTSSFGDELPVWVYEGDVRLEAGAAEGDPERVAAWLRGRLGPRCLAVAVDSLHERSATVRIAASIKEPPRRV
jgi:hypothetical protein